MSPNLFKLIFVPVLFLSLVINMSHSLSIQGVSSPSQQRGIGGNHRLSSSNGSSSVLPKKNSHGYSRLNDTSTFSSIQVEGREDYDDDSCITPQRKNILLRRAGEIVGNGTKNGQLLMSISLFATYFTVMGAKCALPSTLALITSEQSGLSLDNLDTSPQQMIAKVLTISTCAIAFGKFLLGPIIDNYGGILCLKVALSSLMGLLALISSTHSFKIMSISLVGIDFIFSSCWAALLNAIHQSFRQEKWSSCIGLLAVAARTGNASAFFFFASLLQWSQKRRAEIGGLIGQSWRTVFLASAVIQAVPLILLSIGSRNEFDESMQQDDKLESPVTQEEESASLVVRQSNTQTVSPPKASIWQSIRILQKEASTVPFWMHLVSRSCLMIVASFLLFVPSYMTNAFGLSSANSARVGSLYSLGCLISVSIGSKYFPIISTRTKIVSTIGLLGIQVIVSVLQTLHISGVFKLSALAGSLSMFLWGIGFAVPFYIPPSLFALKRGGKESSATSEYKTKNIFRVIVVYIRFVWTINIILLWLVS